MKVVYNWLKDFVDRGGDAAGAGFAPGTCRHQHRQRGSATAGRSDRRRSDFQSPGLPGRLRNRARSRRDFQITAEIRCADGPRNRLRRKPATRFP